jgi:hypothetical protein
MRILPTYYNGSPPARVSHHLDADDEVVDFTLQDLGLPRQVGRINRMVRLLLENIGALVRKDGMIELPPPPATSATVEKNALDRNRNPARLLRNRPVAPRTGRRGFRRPC